jgi:hypothetical protein
MPAFPKVSAWGLAEVGEANRRRGGDVERRTDLRRKKL